MKALLPWALEDADLAFCHTGGLGWDAAEALKPMGTARLRVRLRRRAGRPDRRPGAARRSRALHEQRRLRRHPRQAARGTRRGAIDSAVQSRGLSVAPTALTAAPPEPARSASTRWPVRLSRPAASAPSAIPVTHLLYLHGFRSSPQSTQGEAGRCLGCRPHAVARLVVSAAAALASRSARRRDGDHRRLAGGPDGRHRQLARRLLRDGRRRAHRLSGGGAQSCRRSGPRPDQTHRRAQGPGTATTGSSSAPDTSTSCAPWRRPIRSPRRSAIWR